MPGKSLHCGRAGRALAGSRAVDTYKATVARAAKLAGGVQALSQRLRVPVVELMRWIQGEARPSKGMFLRLVDFIVEEGKKPVLPPPRSERKPGKSVK
jgi:hypothetical protein